MKNLANKNIQKIKPYQPPLAGRAAYDGVLLDFNERTISPSDAVIEALKKFVSQDKLQVYPEYFDLEEKIAEYIGVENEMVMLTNGADQGIELIFRTYTEKGDQVIIPSPSFAMFYQCAGVVGNKIIEIPYRKDLSFPVKEIINKINNDTALIVICNPNNPTGSLASIQQIEEIVLANPQTMVLVDEVYAEFSGVSAIELTKKYPNIICVRTFSKAFGLGGLRIGYVVGNCENVAELIKVRGPYDVNMAGYYAARAALDDIDNVKAYVQEVMTEAKLMVEQFFTKNKIQWHQSAGNFILFRPNNPMETFEKLKKYGFLIRPRKGVNIDSTLRVTIGTKEQMTKFIEIYKEKIL
ncbi:MAG: histidinol-phosphate transaminase [bacterium]|nr:histidinol-phosphate transaminase [bacterium]